MFGTAARHYGSGQYFVDDTFDGAGWWDNGTAQNGLGSGTWIYYPSEMTGGASGGPVFTQFSNGQWGIFAVVNKGDQALAGGVNLSVMLDYRFIDFYNRTVSAVNGGGVVPELTCW